MTKSRELKAAQSRGRRHLAPATVYGRISERLFAWIGARGDWPKLEYQADPVGFARDVLGYTPCRTIAEVESAVSLAKSENRDARVLTPKQIEIIEAAVPSGSRVAVRSGHKIGKTRTLAILALWFYCCFPEARVVMTAVTAWQVDNVLWREVLRVYTDAVVPIDGSAAQKAQTGLQGPGFRQVVGFSAKQPEAVAGLSGAHVLYLIDEASGIEESLFQAIQGNRAGGVRLVMFSNPTQASGFFFDAFHKKKEFYSLVHASSLSTPNAITGRPLIPGLARADWIEEMREEYGGEDSPFFQIRIMGEFVVAEKSKVISVHLITQAIDRWKELEREGKPAEGRLFIGLDPAGPGAGGDDSCFAVRRGLRLLKLYVFASQTEDALLVQLLGIIATHAKKGDRPPVVVLDRSGPIGGKVERVLTGHLDQHKSAFELVSVVSSNQAPDALVKCDRVRDALWWRLAQWFRDGGAIPPDPRLEKELNAPEWFSPQGKDVIKATSKDDLRRELDNRSPDRADALALAVWESSSHARQEAEPARPAKDVYDAPTAIDPYEVDGGVDGNGGDQVYG